MVAIAAHRRDHKNKFDAVAEPFLQGEGLPFSDVLDGEPIQRVLREENALFAQEDISPPRSCSGPFSLKRCVLVTLVDGLMPQRASGVGDGVGQHRRP